jgi:hypothetical protein
MTDKYLDCVQWEEIMSSLGRKIKHFVKKGDEGVKEGEMEVNESKISYKFIPKEDSYINFDKLSFQYTLDWIMKVKIERKVEKKETRNVGNQTEKEKIEVKSPIYDEEIEIPIGYEPSPPQFQTLESRYKPMKKENTETASVVVGYGYSPRPLQSPDLFDNPSTYTPTRIATEENGSGSQQGNLINELFGSSSEVEEEQPKQKKRNHEQEHKSRSHKKIKTNETPKSISTLDTWLGKGSKTPTPSKVTMRACKSKAAKSLKMTNGSSSTSSMEAISEENLEKVQKFLDVKKQEEMLKERRKSELKNYETWTCNNCSNDELKR